MAVHETVIASRESGHGRDARLFYIGGEWVSPVHAKHFPAAPTVKRVTQELGGKSANIILDDADLETVRQGELACFRNSGQSCNAPTRMLVPKSEVQDAAAIAVAKEVRRRARKWAHSPAELNTRRLSG